MGGTFLPMIKVLSLLAGAKQVSLDRALFEALVLYVVPITCFALVAAWLRWRDGARADARDILIALVVVGGAGICFMMTNNPTVYLPLNAILAILLTQRLTQRSSPSAAEAVLVLLLAMWAAVTAVTAIGADGSSLVYGLRSKWQNERTPGASFHSAVLSGAASAEIQDVAMINEGFDLLRPHLRPGDTLASLDLTDFFTYGLGLAAQEGGTSSGLRFGFNFTEKSKPSPEYMMETASLVIVTRSFDDNPGQPISRAYGPYLTSHFHLVAQSARWRLYRRNE
jgi:hypothetical protein